MKGCVVGVLAVTVVLAMAYEASASDIHFVSHRRGAVGGSPIWSRPLGWPAHHRWSHPVGWPRHHRIAHRAGHWGVGHGGVGHWGFHPWRRTALHINIGVHRHARFGYPYFARPLAFQPVHHYSYWYSYGYRPIYGASWGCPTYYAPRYIRTVPVQFHYGYFPFAGNPLHPPLQRQSAPGETMLVGLDARPDVQPPAGEVRQSNERERQRALSFIELGDHEFGKQQFHLALRHYRSAARAAPDVAEAHWRQGHVLVGTGRYDQAVEAFKTALAIDQDVHREGFQLDELYRDLQLTKRSHIESLARVALADRHNADLLFLVGLCLHYDGHADRAAKFFQRSTELDGRRAHLAPFTAPVQRAPADWIPVSFET